MNQQTLTLKIAQSMNLERSFALLLVLAVLLALVGVRPAYAAGNITVDSLADTVANDSACTLREAITNANNDDQSGSADCASGSGADTITLSVSGTITLGSTLPEITSEMTIDGAGQSVTVSGDNAYRVMLINASGTLNLNALTIANGFIGNSEDGGGILNQGALNISNSTFTNNSAASGGAAIGSGSSIFPNAMLVISNSTFTNNAAGNGALYGGGGHMTVLNSTIVGNNGGGISFLYSPITLTNTIIADNPGNDDCHRLIGGTVFVADSYNIDSDGSCDNATTQTSAQLNLGSLADNGGETQTIALLTGSTAIDAGDDTLCPATDQRGVTRPQGAHCDVGAFEAEVEVQSGPTLTVNTPDDHDDLFCTPDDCSLREAINLANAIPGTDTITFDSSVFAPGTIMLSGNLPQITSDLDITGLGETLVIIDGTNSYRPFNIASGMTVSIGGVTIQNGLTSGSGGGINNNGTLTITNSVLSGNSAAGGTNSNTLGGGIYNNGTLTITNSILSGNLAAYGGGIYNHGTLTVTGSTLSGNMSTDGYYGGDGGGIFNEVAP